LTRKHIDQVSTYLAPAPQPAPPPGLAFLFEVGVDWMELVKLCQVKVERKRIEVERLERERLEQERLEILHSPVTPDMVRAIAELRREREHIEILVADDDVFSRRLVSNVLEKNYAVFSCGDGREAILNYVERAPDLIFLDIEMPDFNGHDVLKRIFEFDPNAYVVMLSGHGNRENVMKAIDLGAKGFVGKPFSREKLNAYIGKCPFVLSKEKGGSPDAVSR
jgi:two-component system chemotaxis response regulator CheY